MNFALTEEQEMLRKSARDFLTTKCPRTMVKQMQTDDKGYSPEMWREMADLGWQGLVFPEKHGGSGMGFVELAVLLEEMGRACLPGPFFSTVLLGALPILDAGSDALKQKWLTAVARGKAILTLAAAEESGEFTPDSIAIKAVRQGDGFVLSGTKLFVPDAHVADAILCAARANRGVTLFLVDGKAPGVSTTVLKTMAHDKLCEVVFDGVKAPEDAVVGEVGGGGPVLERTLERAAAGKCCQMLGAMQQMLEMTVEYAKDRKQFDRPIGSFQVIQHYLAGMAVDVDGSRFVTYQAAWKLGEGLPARREVATARAWLGEAFERVSAQAHQIHGAIGVTIDHDLQYFTKRAKAAQLSFGSGDFYREVMAQEMGL